MLSKKILGLLLAASALTPTAAAVIENVNVECVDAATNFVETSSLVQPKMCQDLYAIPPDINDDGKVDIKDYTLLKKYINSDNNIKINEQNADINYDGYVSFLDLLALKDYI